jgi:hypothetical protein
MSEKKQGISHEEFGMTKKKHLKRVYIMQKNRFVLLFINNGRA